MTRNYRAGRAHIHLDKVAGLGYFVELDDEPEIAGRIEARRLRQALGIARWQLIDWAYLDGLAGRGAPPAE